MNFGMLLLEGTVEFNDISILFVSPLVIFAFGLQDLYIRLPNMPYLCSYIFMGRLSMVFDTEICIHQLGLYRLEIWTLKVKGMFIILTSGNLFVFLKKPFGHTCESVVVIFVVYLVIFDLSWLQDRNLRTSSGHFSMLD